MGWLTETGNVKVRERILVPALRFDGWRGIPSLSVTGGAEEEGKERQNGSRGRRCRMGYNVGGGRAGRTECGIRHNGEKEHMGGGQRRAEESRERKRQILAMCGGRGIPGRGLLNRMTDWWD